MKKKNILELDWDDGESLYDDVSFLLFHSVAPSYAFVDDLNKLYHLNLCRTHDMTLDGKEWPLFTDCDNMMKLDYYLVEKPIAADDGSSFWTGGHKLLIVKGDRAKALVDRIHDEFSSPADSYDETDLLAREHAELLESLRGGFTTTTRITPSLPPSVTLSRKAQRDYNALCHMLEQILDYIDMEKICDN